MGNCCGNPSASKPIKPNKGKKPNPFSVEYSRGPTPAPTLTVLKDPTGRDIADRYELGLELGRGEFGVTYLCTSRDDGEKLACKSISKKKLRTAVDIEDVRREVEIMRHMPQHPNIVTLRDTYEDGEAVHLVMELCEGGELFDRIVARGQYTERAADGRRGCAGSDIVVSVNMEAAISTDDVRCAGGFGARHDIGRLLPVAIDLTDFEASLRDARYFEELEGEIWRPGLGLAQSADEK